MIDVFRSLGKTINSRSSEKRVKARLAPKTSLRPSYFTEYSKAASILRCLRTEMGQEKALEQLFYVPPEMANFPASRLGHIRKFVIVEFINYQVSQGAFRKFGYMNYRGYRGGRYSDPKHLPYRDLRMPKSTSTRVLIIGSSVSGAVIANELIKKGVGPITMLEAGPKIAMRNRRKWLDSVMAGKQAYTSSQDLAEDYTATGESA